MPLRSLRPGTQPVALRVPDINAAVVDTIYLGLRAAHPHGTTAVIVADPGTVAAGTRTANAGRTLQLDPGCSQVPVLTAVEAKGLEFDDVVVVEPAEYLHLGDRGRRQLYVALTRATQRLLVLHRRPLPTIFDGLVICVTSISAVPHRLAPLATIRTGQPTPSTGQRRDGRCEGRRPGHRGTAAARAPFRSRAARS